MKRIAAIAWIALLAGCAVTRPQPKIDPAGLDQDSFLSWLADQPLVSTAEAYRAMLIAATGTDPGSDFSKNEQEVFRRDIARREWKLQTDRAIDKATTAFMAAQVAKLRGGINLNLWGRALHVSDRRYAYREVIYEGVPWDNGTPYMVLTGGEFIALLTWADEQRDKAVAPPLPPPPSAPASQPENLPVGQAAHP